MARILWLSLLVPYPPKGGVTQRSFNLLREVSKYHDVHLLAFNQPHLLRNKEDVFAATQALKQYCADVAVVNMPHSSHWQPAFMCLCSTAPFNIIWAKSNVMTQKIKKLLNSTHFDAAHFDTIGLAQYRSLCNVPCVLNHHNVESHMILRRADSESNLLKKAFFSLEGHKLKQYEKKHCGRFVINLTVSDLDKDRLLSFLPSLNIETIPNGVDLDYFSPNTIPSGNPFKLIFVGGLTWYPNIDAMRYFLKDIWPRLRNVEPRFRMTIVGKNPPPDLQALAKNIGGITLTGFVDDIRPYMEEAGIYVCPIRDGGGTKLKMLDAMAMGKPIVAHPIACEGLSLVDGVHVFTASTPGEFVSKIVLLANDSALRRNMAEQGRKLVETNYDFKKIGAKLAHIYDSISVS